MKKTLLIISLLTFLFGSVNAQKVVRLYEGKAPGSEDWNYAEVEFANPGTETKMIRNVVDPTLEVYVPEESISTGTAVVICPGGGNVWLSYESEGTAVAEWLANKGITAFVLKYRLNKTPEAPEEFDDFWNNFGKRIKAMSKESSSENKPVVNPRNYGGEDGLKAVQYVKEHAGEYNVDPEKVGIMGFSAGAGVTTHVILNSDPEYMPDFAAPIYGGWLRGESVPENAPPLFILCAADDRIAAGSPDLFKAWLAAGKSAELHIYSKGGHGFGMDKKGLPVDTWIERLHDWLTATGF
ncbi:alpha/beta hydrolase [Draconibacterium sp. IB214405]|uniref:alpha/beta hydrolase n=1 Tax=Draconibacterium sp. IB214405 TaxID=3097352 RepID=UPI002A151B28|nr:alpha/beta hydrolase [Draconibacterium sp. IB214405]MDX8341169.1 alpha/beta hydrolase [Draconibacterium sp. IB214405]